jgi:hypothetical protein
MKEYFKTGSIGLGILLFIIFLFMKLVGIGSVEHWSWYSVFLPLWLPVTIYVLLFTSVIIINFLKDVGIEIFKFIKK